MRPDETRSLSVVVPVFNGAAWLERVLRAIQRETAGWASEVLVIDDRSTDDSARLLAELSTVVPLRVLLGEGRGPAAALNLALRVATHELICQIDQDVEVLPGWVAGLTRALDENPRLAAAQGVYHWAEDADVYLRVSGIDLLQRYAQIRTTRVDHVCSGNVVYRRGPLVQIGGFDETLGYGYDNDVSYRLGYAGYELALVPTAKSLHHRRSGLAGYLRQQYGYGYGRLDLVAKHPRRLFGDRVSDWRMIGHAALSLAGAGALVVGGSVSALGGDGRVSLALGLAMLATLGVERLIAGVRAFLTFRDRAALIMPAVHLLRDVAWNWAMARWTFHRLLLRDGDPLLSFGRSKASE